MGHLSTYSGDTIWVTDLILALDSRSPLPTVPTTLLTVGSVSYVLVALFLLLIGTSDPTFIFIQLLAATVAAVAPALIWHYDENVFPTFVEEVEDVVADLPALVEVVEYHERFFCRRWLWTAIPWIVLVNGALVANFSFFSDAGATGLTDPAFLTYLGFSTWWSAITGIGIHSMITTVRCVRDVGDLELTIDPLHHDGLGGLSTIGYFSIQATVMNSIGSFTFPLAFAIATRGGYRLLVYLAVGIYVAGLVACFAYPTLYVNRRAQAVRTATLQEKRSKIRELQRQTSEGSVDGELSELETQLKIQTLRDDFYDYRSVNLYPLSVSILTRLASSVLLPIGFTLLETYVFPG